MSGAAIPKGIIELTKLDIVTGEPLAGAVFGVNQYLTGQKVGEFTTDVNGKASIEIPTNIYGYYLYEITPPTGYMPYIYGYSISLTADGEIVTKTIYNTKKTIDMGKVRILKTDADDDMPLEGAVFGIYKSSDNIQVGEMTTDATGVALSGNLPLDSYYLKEISAPIGYELSTKSKAFTLSTKDETAQILIENKKMSAISYGTVSILKTDKDDTRVKLSGAVFGIYDARDDTKIGEITTGSDGTATNDKLVLSIYSINEYYLLELTPPSGYKPSDEKHPFILTTDIPTVSITVENVKLPETPKTAKIKLLKVDAADSTIKLKGAVFGIYAASDDAKVAELTTDAQGVATSGDLALNTYYLKEITAPDGYELSTDKHFAQLNSAGAVVEITVKNVKKAGGGKLKIIKTGANGKPLAGAIFTLYSADGNAITEITTGTDGTVMSGSLATGEYYVIERSAPSGYKRSTEKHTFKIQSSETATLTIKNEPLNQGTLEIYFKHIKHNTELHKSYSYTDYVGKEYMPWVMANGLDKMAIPSYTFVKADCPSTTALIDGKLVITYWYDNGSGTGDGSGTNGNGGSGGGSGNTPTNGIPKTGEPLPWWNIVLSFVFIVAAAGIAVWTLRKQKQSSGD